MTCDRIRNELGAYADRELSATRRTAVEEHLRLCEGCREELARLKGVASILREDVIPEVPLGLAERILARGQRQLAQKGPRRVLHVYWWEAMPSYMRAAAVVMLMVGLTSGTWLGLNVASKARSQLAISTTPEADIASSIRADYLTDSPIGSAADVYRSLASSTDGVR